MNRCYSLTALLLAGITAFQLPADAASLIGTKGTQPASLSLNTEGTSDWSHWGLNAATDWNHKSGVTSQISNMTKIGTATVNRYTDGTMTCSWTGGTPTSSASSSRAGIYVAGLNNGFQITVPADTTLRTLRVYCGLWKSQGKLEATLSDGSAPAFVDTTHGSTTGSANTMFTLQYSAASAGQNLTVKWTVQTSHDTSGTGTVGWQAATLVTESTSNPGPTVSISSPASGSTYAAPATVPINATASDSNGTVSGVDFFAGSTPLGNDGSSPYSVTWNSVAAGSYSLTARASDNGGASTTSSSVSITVTGSSSSTSAPSCGSPSGGFTDNPIATKYGSTTYPWTANIKWNCVFNINDYSGSSTEARFNAARDAASANGGGVVYFPGGTYNFGNDLYLKSGVVIRGAGSNGDGKSSTYAPGARLNFPKYNASLSGSGTPNSTAFKKIMTTAPDTDSNIGLVNVDINRAGIKLLGQPDTGSNRNIIVFGTRINNVSTPDGSVPTSWQNAWQRWPNRFEANIKVQAFQNVLIANNRMNDAITDNFDQPGYKIKDGTNTISLSNGSYARYSYSDIGNNIEVNWKSGHAWYCTPANEPSMFRTGIVIRDNWMSGTKTTAIHASGQGMIVKDNIRKDGGSSKYVWLYPTGQKKASGPDFNRNRGWDVSGYDYIVEGNDIEVYNHIIGWTPQYRCNDGESCHDNQGSLVNGGTYRNNILRGGTVIMIYRTKQVNNILVTNNTVLSNGSLGNNNSGNNSVFIWSDLTGGDNYPISNTRVESNQLSQHVHFVSESASAGGNTIRNNVNPNGNGTIKHSCEAKVSISGNSGFSVSGCQ